MAKKKKGKFNRSSTENAFPNTPKGLHNLGNTCFLNSTLQCVCRVFQLRELIQDFQKNSLQVILKQSNDKGDTKTLQLSLNKLAAPFSEAYVSFVCELFGSENTRSSISPTMLRSALIKLYPRFDGFGQHDSHEVLRCLLDGLRQEELRIWQRAILDEYKCTPRTSDDLKEEIRVWGRTTGLSTAVDRLFGGVLLTSLTCHECDNVVQHFEVFLDLSLPILGDVDLAGCKGLNTSGSTTGTAPKTKRELKKERKAKTKINRRKVKGQQRFSSPLEDDDEEEPVDKTKRSKKKGKYSRNRRDSSSDDSEDFEEGEEITESDESPVQEPPKELVANGLSGGHSSPVGSPADGVSRLKLENGFTDDICKAICVELPPFVDVQEPPDVSVEGDNEEHACKHSAAEECQSADEAADLEDNVGGGVSDSSATPPPAPNSLDESLARDMVTKLRISSAGSLPSEETQALEASQLAITELMTATLEPSSGDCLPTDLERYLARYTAAERLSGSNQTTCEVCTRRASGVVGGGKSVRCDSTKRDLIIRPPAVLTIHLKRFQQSGYRLQKCSNRVTFPVNLDLRPFCSRLARLSMGEGHYRLFGVVEHSGNLRGGHYVCYVAEDPDHGLPQAHFVAPLDKPDPWPMHLQHLVYQLRRGDRRVVNPSPSPSSAQSSSCSAPVDEVADQSAQTGRDRRWFYCSDSHVSPASLAQVLSCQPYLLFYERIR